MDKNDLQINQDENAVNDISEKIELATSTSIVTKEELLQTLIGKDGVEKKRKICGTKFYTI